MNEATRELLLPAAPLPGRAMDPRVCLKCANRMQANAAAIGVLVAHVPISDKSGGSEPEVIATVITVLNKSGGWELEHVGCGGYVATGICGRCGSAPDLQSVELIVNKSGGSDVEGK